MLPNWLYGKSKSKLAELLGGGGTPSDYNQVKAQVTQNTENIASLDTSNQALTNQVNDMVNVLGSKNLLYNPPTSFTDNGLTFTTNDDGEVSIVGTHTRSTGNTNLNIFGNQLEVGTYKFSIEGNILGTCLLLCTDSAVGTGTYKRLAGLSSARNEEEFTYTQADKIQYPYIWAQLSVSYTNVDVNTVYKPMIRLASITDNTYVPYAKTNKEITDVLTADANLGTAVDLSSYTAYSNLYTAPSDGYVHFVSAASGSVARTIYTYSNNTTAATDPHFTHSTSENNKAFEIFIKKGLKIYADGLQTGDTINFYPLT